MAVFYIYADDSGKYANEKNRYTALCGFVAHIEDWRRFSLEWMNCRMKWGVPPIHMRFVKHPDRDEDWQKVKDEWGGQWDDKRKLMLEEFAAIVERNHLFCLGAVVDAGHYRSLTKSMFKEEFTPLSFAFMHVVLGGIHKTEFIDSRAPISIILDDDQESSVYCYELLQRLRAVNPKVNERVDCICFGNDRSYPALQAADMIAGETREFMETLSAEPGAESSEIFQRLTLRGKHQPILYSAEKLNKMERESLAAVRTKHDSDWI